MIDQLVMKSNGAYTHDDIFKLEANFAFMLMLTHYERDCYFDRMEQVKQEYYGNRS